MNYIFFSSSFSSSLKELKLVCQQTNKKKEAKEKNKRVIIMLLDSLIDRILGTISYKQLTRTVDS